MKRVEGWTQASLDLLRVLRAKAEDSSFSLSNTATRAATEEEFFLEFFLAVALAASEVVGGLEETVLDGLVAKGSPLCKDKALVSKPSKYRCQRRLVWYWS